MDPYIDTVSVCSTGRVGLVVRKEFVNFPGGESKEVYSGIGLDGKGLWCSSKPVILHPNIESYMDRLVLALSQPGCVYPPLGSGSLNPIKA